MQDVEEKSLSIEEQKKNKIKKLLLKVKNGTPQQRKSALRQLSDKAVDFGPGPIFSEVLPLMMSPALEDQERHLLVKVIDRVLYKLDDLVRPWVRRTFSLFLTLSHSFSHLLVSRPRNLSQHRSITAELHPQKAS